MSRRYALLRCFLASSKRLKELCERKARPLRLRNFQIHPSGIRETTRRMSGQWVERCGRIQEFRRQECALDCRQVITASFELLGKCKCRLFVAKFSTLTFSSRRKANLSAICRLTDDRARVEEDVPWNYKFIAALD
jgi:hypothetical protein